MWEGGTKFHPASAGNRTRINCLEGSYADHYTTDALSITRCLVLLYISIGSRQGEEKTGLVRSGIRTHALRRGLRPERSALDHSAILTGCGM